MGTKPLSKLTVPRCRHSHIYKCCQLLRCGNSVLEVAVFENVGEKTFTAHSRMVWSLERVLLIDFDWCGMHGEDTYPVSLNDLHDPANSINWHPDIRRGG